MSRTDKRTKPKHRSRGKRDFDKEEETLQQLEEFGVVPSPRQRLRTKEDYNKVRHQDQET